jgi:hypothetical protein
MLASKPVGERMDDAVHEVGNRWCEPSYEGGPGRYTAGEPVVEPSLHARVGIERAQVEWAE